MIFTRLYPLNLCSQEKFMETIQFKSIFLVSLLSISMSFVCGQEVHEYVNSAGIINDHKLVMDIMEQRYPGYNERVLGTFDRNNYVNMSKGAKSTLHQVNVVFHVVYQDPEENIPDSVIYSQVDVLNEDYQRLNADSVNLRSIFTPIAGKPNIHFNVAQIIRVPTTSTFSVSLTGLPDNVKETASGGSDAWDTEHYVNIWVCKLESFFGILFGYAYPPDGLSNWPAGSAAPSPELEGVVLDYRSVGRNNPVPFDDGSGGTFYINGRTATHEVGHYFGMRHIWGDGGGIFGGDSCGEDDGIADTPNQGAQSNNNCDPSLNTCIDSVGTDMPDLIENHMDYSEEACKNMWTQMQSAFMRNVLENERQGLLNAAAIEEKFPIDFSLFPNPASEICSIVIPTLDEVGELVVVDLLGKLLFTKTIAPGLANVATIPTNKMNAGIYIVTLRTSSNAMSKKLTVY
jgi:hypothetical protein